MKQIISRVNLTQQSRSDELDELKSHFACWASWRQSSAESARQRAQRGGKRTLLLRQEKPRLMPSNNSEASRRAAKKSPARPESVSLARWLGSNEGVI
jgi:hypothetical protein